VDKAWLYHAAVTVRVVAVLFGMSPMIAQCAPLQQFISVGKVAALVTPVAAVGHPAVISNPCLSNKLLSFEDLRCRESPGEPIPQDEGALDWSS
jgi:hypothetical protein